MSQVKENAPVATKCIYSYPGYVHTRLVWVEWPDSPVITWLWHKKGKVQFLINGLLGNSS